MNVSDGLATFLRDSLSDIKSELAVHTEIIKRVECKVDDTSIKLSGVKDRTTKLEHDRTWLLGFAACLTLLNIPSILIYIPKIIERVLAAI